MSAPDLRSVAGWDLPIARAAATTLATVADRLPAWRGRVDAVGRQLTTAPCWTGPAATSAAEAVALLSAVTTALSTELSDSLADLGRCLARSGGAQELAERATGLAAVAGVELDSTGAVDRLPPPPTPAMAPDQAAVLIDRVRTATAATALAEQALDEALQAAVAAATARDRLSATGASSVPVDFDRLTADLGVVGPAPVPAVPAGWPPGQVATWWAGLSLAAQLAAVRGVPQLVGGLDGVPGWARDRANRVLLQRALLDPCGTAPSTATVVAGVLAAEEAAGRPVQLLEFDAAGGRVAVALGDVDTAAAVGLVVPGMCTTVVDDLGDLVDKAGRFPAPPPAAAPATAVATVAWLGYQTPPNLVEADSRADARAGGAELDDALTGLAAARRAAGGAPPRTTVIAHSYGTVVVGEAAVRPGRLPADAVALLGSPGMGWRGAPGVEAPEVYAAGALADPVSYLGRYGVEPTDALFGATLLPTDPWTTHGAYFDPGHPTLAALGRVVVGRQPHR